MILKRICDTCGKEFEYPHWRAAKFCSIHCQRLSLKAKLNVVCTCCGREFHLKQSQINRYKRNFGVFCSKECYSQVMSERMKGGGNHQYGKIGLLNASTKNGITTRKNNRCNEKFVLVSPNYATQKKCRASLHRFLVEINYERYDAKYFEVVNGVFRLRKDVVVHHIDCNHDNNDISNLTPLTKGEHISVHNKLRYQKKDKTTGRFTK